MGKGSFKKAFFILATFLSSISLFILLGEGLCRLFWKDYLNIDFWLDEKNLTYRYDEILGWFPKENSQKYFTGSRRIFVKHNSRGFRDNEHKEKQKPRIVFLGDSFVWGYDVNQEERFTEKLQEIIPSREIINLGVSGYGTDQEYLLLRRQFDYYAPDIVFLIFCGNDNGDNSSNVRYQGYFKPYFVKDGPILKLKGVPVPKSILYYIPRYKNSYLFRAFARIYFSYTTPKAVLKLPDPTKAIIKMTKSFVENRGAVFVIGFEETAWYDDLTSFCRQNNIRFIDVRNNYKYPANGNHWDPIGHKLVSLKIYNYLKENDL